MVVPQRVALLDASDRSESASHGSDLEFRTRAGGPIGADSIGTHLSGSERQQLQSDWLILVVRDHGPWRLGTEDLEGR
jgi:hypothetical protein